MEFSSSLIEVNYELTIKITDIFEKKNMQNVQAVSTRIEIEQTLTLIRICLHPLDTSPHCIREECKSSVLNIQYMFSFMRCRSRNKKELALTRKGSSAPKTIDA